MLNSKSKGNVGETMILCEFVKMGVQVYIPYGDNARYDLIADFNGKLNKIQVKYCNSITENGSYNCHCISSKNHTTNKRCDHYNDDVDYIAFYIAPINKCLLVPIDIVGKRTRMYFRVNEPKNKQKHKIYYIEDYIFSKILSAETLHGESKSEQLTHG